MINIRVESSNNISPSKTRNGVIYSKNNIMEQQDYEAATILMSLRNRPVVLTPIQTNFNIPQHNYNTRYSSRMGTSYY